MNEKNYLDADELLQLAVNASQLNDHESAITYLKRAIELTPNHAKAYYFLGAEHAQIGMYDRAVQEMEKAIDLDPALTTAVFQLGLLHMTSGKIDDAMNVWQRLDELGEENSFYCFKTGLINLIQDNFEGCESYLQKGIALNNFNEALNGDMNKILTEIQEGRNDGRITEGAEPLNQEGNNFFLSAYKDSN